MEKQEFLYRYTSIENLALTLKNHTIRLNPLDKMDDLQEQRTKDVENIGKFVFISSWTEEEKEDIPMWKMYTDMRVGVRIKLPKNPFRRMGTTMESMKEVSGLNKAETQGGDQGAIDTFLDYGDLLKRKLLSPQAWSGDILIPVQYTDDISLLEPEVRDVAGEKIGLQLEKLGCYKNTYWKFQKEWRYRMVFMRFDVQNGVGNSFMQFTGSVNNMARGMEQPPIRYFDLEIAQEHFETMEITTSPQMSLGNRILLETLVEKYNPTALIKESELRNLI